MAAPTLTQSASGATVGSQATLDVTINGVAAGATLVACLFCRSSNVRNWTLSDDNGDTWTQAENHASGRSISLQYVTNVTGGDTTVTADIDYSDQFDLCIFELSASTFDASSKFANSNINKNQDHYCAASGEIDTAADVYVVAMMMMRVTPGTVADPSGFSQIHDLTSGQPYGLVWGNSSASALTDERATWSCNQDFRNTSCAIASFAGVGGGGGGSIVPIVLQLHG